MRKFFSIVMMSAVLWVMRYVMYSGLVYGCLTVVFGSIIWFLVPVEDRNKPLNEFWKSLDVCSVRRTDWKRKQGRRMVYRMCRHRVYTVSGGGK